MCCGVGLLFFCCCCDVVVICCCDVVLLCYCFAVLLCCCCEVALIHKCVPGGHTQEDASTSSFVAKAQTRWTEQAALVHELVLDRQDLSSTLV